MTGEILLDEATAEKLSAAAVLFLATARADIGPFAPEAPDAKEALLASLATQALLRALYDSERPETYPVILAGGAEGVGMLVGLVEEAGARAAVFNMCVQSMDNGARLQARIHTTVGSG